MTGPDTSPGSGKTGARAPSRTRQQRPPKVETLHEKYRAGAEAAEERARRECELREADKERVRLAEDAQEKASPLCPVDFAILAECTRDPFGVSPYAVEKRVKEGVAGLSGYSFGYMYKRFIVLYEMMMLSVVDWLGPDPAHPNDRRTLYTITPLGLRVLHAWWETPIAVPATNDSDLIPRLRSVSHTDAHLARQAFERFERQTRNEMDDLDYLHREVRREGRWGARDTLGAALQRALLSAYADWARLAAQHCEDLQLPQLPGTQSGR